MLTFLIALAIVAGIGAGVYFFVIKRKATTTTSTPPVSSGWQFQNSNNVSGTPEDFDFPQSDGVHYCVKWAPALSAGKVITLGFTLSGGGTLVPTQGATPYISLYIQRVGDNMSGAGEYQQYRYYHSGIPLGTQRDYSISVPFNADQWGDVLGSSGADHQYEFLACLDNASYIGFVFGDPGAGATGHGVYANGPVHFHLNEFSVT